MPGLSSSADRLVPHLRFSLLVEPWQRVFRLQLSTEIGRGFVDGAWWPYGRDLAVEVLDLVRQFPPMLGRLCRVVYSPSDWGGNRRRGIQAGEAIVGIGSPPRSDDAHMVMLGSVSPRVSRVVRLLVVPPEWEETAALYAMRAAANPSNTASGSTILDESLELLHAGLSPHGYRPI